jgi:two-component system, chemotaxis family, chemotaxis protein CheY
MKTGDRDIPILIVDDYKTMLRVVRKLLAEIGFENVEAAGDGPSALALLRRKPFRLVISDWNMAPMTGLELLKEVRADRELQDLPFVMMTADNSAEHEILAKQEGAATYIVKPFNAGTLRQAIESTLGAGRPQPSCATAPSCEVV